MNDNAKAESEKIWNMLREEVEALSAKITAFYAASGSTRTCRHINELWRSENAAVGIGFVPPEAREGLELLLIKHGIHVLKSHGPLGKNVYFSLLHDTQLTPERLNRLCASVEQETLARRETPIATPKPTMAAEMIIEEQVARMEGRPVARPEKPRNRPEEVVSVVDSFNNATKNMNPAQAAKFLSDAIPYFELPEDMIRELLRVIDIVRSTE